MFSVSLCCSCPSPWSSSVSVSLEQIGWWEILFISLLLSMPSLHCNPPECLLNTQFCQQLFCFSTLKILLAVSWPPCFYWETHILKFGSLMLFLPLWVISRHCLCLYLLAVWLYIEVGLSLSFSYFRFAEFPKLQNYVFHQTWEKFTHHLCNYFVLYQSFSSLLRL